MTRTERVQKYADEIGYRVYGPHEWFSSEAYSLAPLQILEGMLAGQSSSLPTTKEILLSNEVEDDNGFWTALHELGHAYTTPDEHNIWLETSRDRMVEHETNAWKWALDHAGEQPTPHVASTTRRKLLTYLDADPGSGMVSGIPWTFDPGTAAGRAYATDFLDGLDRLAEAA